MAKSNIKLNKKSNLLDFVTVGETFFIAVIMAFILYLILSNFSTGITNLGLEQNYTGIIEGARDKTTHSVDWGMLAFVVTALIFSVIAARKIPTEPLYIAIVLGMSFAFFIISFIIANVFGKFMDTITFSNFVNVHMPITKILLQYFPYVTAVYLGIVIIVFFAKDDIPM